MMILDSGLLFWATLYSFLLVAIIRSTSYPENCEWLKRQH